jgi:predicted nucleotidyltransferase
LCFRFVLYYSAATIAAPEQLQQTIQMRQNCECMTATRIPETPLTREQAIDWLVASEQDIRALGVQRLALFGSVARGQARLNSDVDLLVEFFPGAKTYNRFLALSELLEGRLGCRVELVTMESLSPFLGPRILAEAEDVLRAA